MGDLGRRAALARRLASLVRYLRFFSTRSTILGMAERRKPALPGGGRRSIRRRWPRSRPGSASATRTSRSSRRCARAPTRLGRAPTMKEFARRPGGDDAPADRDRALRYVECRQARGRARAAALCDARGARRRCCAGSATSSGGSPTARDLDDAPRHDAVEVALLAHVRLALERAARGGLRRRGGGGAARARDRAGRRARTAARPAAEVRRLGRRRGAQTRELLTEWQVYRMFDARRGAWATFQFLVRERLLDDGVDVALRRLAGGSG